MNKKSAVILAAGKGTRFLPLTTTTPKPLLKVAGKPAVQYSLEGVAPYVNEIIMVVGYLKEVIQDYFGKEFQGIPIKYVPQKDYSGTASAVNLVKGQLNNSSFFLIYGDDLYDSSLFDKLSAKETAVMGKKENNWQNFGVFHLKNGKYLEKIIEKPTEFVGDLVNIGLYLLNDSIFDYFEKIKISPRGEYEFTDMLSLFAQDNLIEVMETENGWIPLSYPWDLLEANRIMLEKMETQIDGEVEPFATINGKLHLGKGSIIKNGSYLEGNVYVGEDSIIGPNCSIKGFANIGNKCCIGNAVEICRSIIGNGVNAKHLSYIGDSILGNEVNVAAGCVTANLRHDHEEIKVMVNGKLVSSKRCKFGTIIGDKAKLGVNTSIYPGRKIDSKAWTLPGEVIKDDESTPMFIGVSSLKRDKALTSGHAGAEPGKLKKD